MKTKLLSILVCLLVCMLALPAFADTLETQTYVSAVDLPDNDELFAAYADQTLYGSGGISFFSSRTAGSQLTGTDKEMYEELKALIAAVANGNQESTDFALTTTYTFSSESEMGTLLRESLSIVIDALMNDCPYELYWYDKIAGVKMNYSYTPGATIEVKPVLKFHVASAYAGNKDFAVDTTKTSAASAAAAKAAAIVAEHKDESDLDKLKAYRDAICELTDYNDDAASDNYAGGYGDPWQLIWVFDGNDATTVVCEGYSKAFQYLCDLSNFTEGTECYTVEGTMNGGTGAGRHMWNIVTLNGKNLLVDVTNSDSGSVGQDGSSLFLAAPASGSPDTSYVFKSGYNLATDITYIYDNDLI